MADIGTIFIDMSQGADYELDALGLVEDDGLDTAVIISLFTDRRANTDDVLPGDSTNLRGWWADAYPGMPGDKIGSRLWLLSREKQLNIALNRAKEYAEEALQWLVTDTVVKSVQVTATIVRSGVMGIHIEIMRSNSTVRRYRFDKFWSN
ncbi:MAG: phage GP46 family protein [Gallionella sp.]|jgi:phage gp46-like protein